MLPFFFSSPSRNSITSRNGSTVFIFYSLETENFPRHVIKRTIYPDPSPLPFHYPRSPKIKRKETRNSSADPATGLKIDPVYSLNVHLGSRSSSALLTLLPYTQHPFQPVIVEIVIGEIVVAVYFAGHKVSVNGEEGSKRDFDCTPMHRQSTRTIFSIYENSAIPIQCS